MSRIVLNAGAAPSTPAAGKVAIYEDSADPVRVKALDANGQTHSLSPANMKFNYLINGGFAFAQRSTPGTLTTMSNTSGRTYLADRWGMTNENTSFQYQRIDSNAANETNLNARYYGKFKKITSTGKMIVSQVLSGDDTGPLRNKTVRFQCKMRYTVAASMTVRMGLLQLTSAGTIDTIPGTFVSAFGAAGVDPTWGTNLSLIAPTLVDGGTSASSAMTCVLTANWVRYSATFLVPASAKNIVAAIWTHNLPVANDEFNIAEIAIFDGQEIMEWNPRGHVLEMLQCQRFYFKTFAIDTLPAQAVGINTGEIFFSGIAAAAVTQRGAIRWPVQMRGTPTITYFNPVSGNAFARDESGNFDTTATSTISAANDREVTFQATGNASSAAGCRLGLHLTADAEL